MVALYRCGRQADALRAFSTTLERLVEELGVEPGPVLRALELRILDHDEELLGHEVIRTGSFVPPTVVGQSRDASEPDAFLVVGDTKVPLIRAVTTIGREPDRVIFLDDDEASRRHAEIRRIGSEFVLVDLGSLNGTKVNDIEVAEHTLSDGDEIQIGQTSLLVQLVESGD